MKKYRLGKKYFDFKGGLPRLYLHEKNEKVVRWIIRAFTAMGIVLSVFSLPWYLSLAISILLVVIAWFTERTLFYYTSMFVSNMMLNYDPKKWVAMVFVSLGEPKDPSSKKIVGIWLKNEEYASSFFQNLHALTGRNDNHQGDLRLTFVVDEDMYYVFLYADFDREAYTKFVDRITKANLLRKYGKEHFPLIMSQVICHGFETTGMFALGMFLDTNPTGKEFVLAPYVTGVDGKPTASEASAPIYMDTYKFKLPHELTEDDLEYVHWRKLIKRTALGSGA